MGTHSLPAPPCPCTRALTVPAGHQNPLPLGAACTRGAGAASLSPPRCPPLSPGDPPSARGSAAHSKRGVTEARPPPAAAGCPHPSIFALPSLSSSPRGEGSGRPAVGKGLWGSGAGLGAAGGAAPQPRLPASPSAPPAAAPARKSLLPPPCKTVTISAGVTQNPATRGPAAPWLGALPAGRGTSTNRSGSKPPEPPGCCCRARRYARSSASCASFSFLNLCGTRVAMSPPGPCHPPAPRPVPRVGCREGAHAPGAAPEMGGSPLGSSPRGTQPTRRKRVEPPDGCSPPPHFHPPGTCLCL